MSEPVAATDGFSYVYAVFSTPESNVRMSAVCAYRMETIKRVFDYGHFKIQKNVQSFWVPYRPHESIPAPRPGSVSDTVKYPHHRIVARVVG